MNDPYDLATRLGRQADAAASDEEALQLYLRAWEAVPEPRLAWEGAIWIWNNVASIHADAGRSKDALHAAQMAERARGGARHSQVQFTLGRIHLECFNDPERAREHLQRAWDLSEGREFEGKSKKYVQALKGGITVSENQPHATRENSSVLTDPVHEKIEDLCGLGDELVEQERIEEALQHYTEALSLLPEPCDDWEAFTWIQSAIGDAHFRRKHWSASEAAFQLAMRGPDGLGNPFIHLRLGQCAFEQEHMTTALDELLRAYMGGGEEIFDEDRKYFDFLRSQVNLSPPSN